MTSSRSGRPRARPHGHRTSPSGPATARRAARAQSSEKLHRPARRRHGRGRARPPRLPRRARRRARARPLRGASCRRSTRPRRRSRARRTRSAQAASCAAAGAARAPSCCQQRCAFRHAAPSAAVRGRPPEFPRALRVPGALDRVRAHLLRFQARRRDRGAGAQRAARGRDCAHAAEPGRAARRDLECRRDEHRALDPRALGVDAPAREDLERAPRARATAAYASIAPRRPTADGEERTRLWPAGTESTTPSRSASARCGCKPNAAAASPEIRAAPRRRRGLPRRRAAGAADNGRARDR